MNNEVISNGRASEVATVPALTEDVKPKKTRASSGQNNKAIDFRLDIDAGAKRIKSRLNGKYKAFPSEGKEIKGEVPLRNDGCFVYKKKSYIIGRGHDRASGKMIMASQDNKLSCLDLWILGALTHYRKELKAVVDSRRRKAQPCQINLHLRIVTLSSMLRKDLDKMLKQIENFIWEDTEFKIIVKSCEFKDEGEGAALEVAHNKNCEQFHLLDLGGGTITHTSYGWDGEDLSVESRTPISGGGMVDISNKIFKALTRTDRGVIQAESDEINEALELSKVEDCGWNVALRTNGKLINIADEVEGALSEWVAKNYAIRKQFDLISQRLARGENLFCSGGGFAVTVVAEWIIRYLGNGVSDAKIEVLPSPEHINVTGLKYLDKE